MVPLSMRALSTRDENSSGLLSTSNPRQPSIKRALERVCVIPSPASISINVREIEQGKYRRSRTDSPVGE